MGLENAIFVVNGLGFDRKFVEFEADVGQFRVAFPKMIIVGPSENKTS